MTARNLEDLDLNLLLVLDAREWKKAGLLGGEWENCRRFQAAVQDCESALKWDPSKNRFKRLILSQKFSLR
jgi:hypothetical protein